MQLFSLAQRCFQEISGPNGQGFVSNDFCQPSFSLGESASLPFSCTKRG